MTLRDSQKDENRLILGFVLFLVFASLFFQRKIGGGMKKPNPMIPL